MLKIFAIFLVFSSVLHARIIIISDVDDTIKVTHGLSSKSVMNYFKGESASFPEMDILYHEWKNMGGQFLYLSSSYQGIYDARKWIQEYQFPEGKVIQRDEDSYLDGKLFKKEELVKVFTDQEIYPDDLFLFLGDNFGEDDEVYEEIVREFKLEKQSIIMIRDILLDQCLPGMDVKGSPVPGVHYYISARDLADVLFPMYFSGTISFDALILSSASYYEKKAFTEFQVDSLKKRLKGRYCEAGDLSCQNFVVQRSLELLRGYYGQ